MNGDISPERIVLPEHHDPLVSILIPVYGKVEFTVACLESIARTSEATSFEILVLDDRSLDDTVLQIKKIKSVRIIENPENLGFLRSCNFGAKHAKGKYLYFLNNDTIVKPGWLDNLVKTFDIFKEVGLVGSKLVYPDGSLQEAGGILWNDGSAWNYGNKQDPSLPQFNYARDADYISGASIMLPTKLFHELGGFDELYAPAYYEDTDIAMRVRARGLRVIYQPLSEVVHFEGISSGTDISTGTKAYQVTNRTKFFKRWEQELHVHRPNGLEPHLERDRRAKGRVLFIDACTPTPDQDSGSVDILNLLRVFVEMSWAVTFIPEDNYVFMEKYTSALQKIGVQALYYPHIKSVDDHITEHGDSYDLVMSFRPLVTQKLNRPGN
jgi:GT2 family glycosyltransferase